MKFEKYFDRKQQRNCWRFDFTIRGQRIREGGFARKFDAENAVAAIRLLFERRKYGLPGADSILTIGDLLRQMERDRAVNRRRLTIFRQFVDTLGDSVEILRLKRSHFVEFLEYTQTQKLQPATQKNYLDNVSTILSNAGLYFPTLEEYRPPRLPTRPQAIARRRILSKEELGKFFTTIVKPRFPGEQAQSRAIRMKLFDIARLMLLTGARREHLMTIEPLDLRVQQRTLVLESSKVRRAHYIALGELSLEILQQRFEATPAGRGLFDGITNQIVTKILTRVAFHAGLEYGQRTETGWTLHDFRRTAATVIEDAGLPYSAVSAQLGHKRADITARYTVPQISTQRRAAEILENWCRDIDGILWGCRDSRELQRVERKIESL